MKLAEISKYLDELSAQWNDLIATKHPDKRSDVRVDLIRFTQCRTECANVVRMLGTAGQAWADSFNREISFLGTAMFMQGAVQGMKKAIERGMLVNVEDLVLAETFDDLLEQGDYLLDHGYFLAAGVLGRAVLEEHLRKWCDRSGCAPTISKPTIEHFKTSLYTANHLDKISMKHVEAMAAIGNDAAHANAGLKADDVERLLHDVRAFLTSNRLP
jgi:hypothetical protein